MEEENLRVKGKRGGRRGGRRGFGRGGGVEEGRRK